MMTFGLLPRAVPLYAMAFLASVLTAVPSRAQQSYPSPEDAAAALAAAVRTGTTSAMLKVLGYAGRDIIESGDDVADTEARARFVSAYDAKHSIKTEGNTKATLVLGNDDFQFPVPLLNQNAGWKFDPAAGRREILFRRIGRNELDAIQTCLAFVDAQNEYAGKDRGNGAGVYAQRIVSTPGRKDGLFWRDDSDPSPLGELAAKASAEGYRTGDDRPAPYHGYYFRILRGQGADAPGGALDYVVKGKMIGGFGLIAYPAEYGNSGVMTFVVNHAGTVFEKDLGPRTESIARRVAVFDPDQTWKKADATSP
jgi:hypothetical protein